MIKAFNFWAQMKSDRNHNLKYLVVNSEDESWGLHISTIGFQSIPPNSSYPPKGHPSSYWFHPNSGRILHEFQIVYITKGKGVFESTNCTRIKINSGTVIMLFPEEWHTYQPAPDTGWDAYWIGFNGDNMQHLVKNHFFTPKDPILNIGFIEQMVLLFKQGIEIANYEKTSYQQVLAGITTLMLGNLYYSEKNNSFRDKEIISQINRARMIMRENTDQNISPETIAKTLNLSYSWFRRVFKQYTGFSPAQYQMEIKLQKSKELLTSTNMSVKEIAFELNFESLSYFSTFFKSKMGSSPLEYRKIVRGNSVS